MANGEGARSFLSHPSISAAAGGKTLFLLYPAPVTRHNFYHLFFTKTLLWKR